MSRELKLGGLHLRLVGRNVEINYPGQDNHKIIIQKADLPEVTAFLMAILNNAHLN